MSAHARKTIATPAPAIELVTARCSVCASPRARCANVRGQDAPVCFACALTMAQMIAYAEQPSNRPHGKGCSCMECGAFDAGQRGEVANHLLVDVEGRVLSDWTLSEFAERVRNLEIDD